MKLVIPRISANPAGRDFAVGDIHGHFTALRKALDHIGFKPGADRLFSVGDLVDRGPESEQVLDWLAQPWFHAIAGNHELMTWRAALGDPYPHVDHSAHGGQWLAPLPQETQARIGAALQALPIAMEVETTSGLIGLVHADCPYDQWRRMHDDQSEEDIACCQWSIARYQRQYSAPVQGIEAVIHGHVTLRFPALLGNVYYIDTGGGLPSGFFSLLELKTLTLYRGPPGPGRR